MGWRVVEPSWLSELGSEIAAPGAFPGSRGDIDASLPGTRLLNLFDGEARLNPRSHLLRGGGALLSFRPPWSIRGGGEEWSAAR